MPLATPVVASSRTRAVARLAALRRACALGGVSLAVLAPAVQAQTARPSGEVRPDASARQARRASRLAAPVRRIDASAGSAQAAGAPQAPLTARSGRIAFAAGVANPFGLPSSTPFVSGAAPADSYRKPAYADLDGDGDVDILYGRNDGQFTYYQNTAGPNATPIYATGVLNPFGLRDIGTANERAAPAVGDVDGDGDLDVLVGEKSGNFSYFQNTAGPGVAPTFAGRVTNPFGLSDVGDGATPALADLDGDGDLDVLSGRNDGTFVSFQNTAGAQATPTFTRAASPPAGLTDIGYNSAPTVGDLDGDGDLDVLAGRNFNAPVYFENTAGPRAAPTFATGAALPGVNIDRYNTGPALADGDGDGDLDILVGSTAAGNGGINGFTYYQNTTAGPAAFAASTFLPGLNPANTAGRAAPATGDFDGDGDVDLLIGGLDGTFTYRVNTAGPNATPAYAAAPVPVGLTDIGNSSAPAVGDLDGDGDLDVLAGEYNGGFFYFQNTAGPNAAPAFASAPVPVGLTDIGTYSRPALADFDGDGDLDVLAGRSDGTFVYFRNTASPREAPSFFPAPVPAGLDGIGSNSAPAVGDLDGDGDLDVLAGEYYGSFFYFRNTAGPSATPVFTAAPTPGGLTDVGYYSKPAIADLDGDGDADVLSGSTTTSVDYFRNTSDPGTITATLTGTEGYRQLAAPTGTPFGDVLGANIFTQGIAGGDATNGQPNVLRYDETVPGAVNLGYVAPGSLDTPLGIGRGAFVYVFADEDPRPTAPGIQGGFPKTLQAAGRPERVEFDWGGTAPDAPLTFTDSGSAADDGWNLLGNPFGSWFDWDAVDLANVNAPVYVYDNVTANYLTHTRGIPTAGSLPGGIVGPFQGFWAQANAAAPAITARAAVTSGGPLYRSGGPTVVGLRLRPGAGSALPAGVQSETFLALGVPGAHDEVSALDAFALTPPAQNYVLLATQAAGTDGAPTSLAIDARPAQTAAVTVELDLTQVVGGAAAGGALVLDWPALDLPEGWSARLLDRQQNVTVDLSQATEYPLTLAGPAAATGTPALDVLALTTSPRVAAESLTAGRFALVVSPRGATAGEGDPGQTLALSAARPNPTTGAATLVLSLPTASDVRVAVYDVLGRQVAVLAEGQRPAGETTVRVAAGALAAGTYVVRATVGAHVLTQRLTVTR